jgi:hypothetical protein|uniref:Uncharacterized protein n=1 Tax=Eutreptiella gymnastica TaxID=73025 RepID=A0A7S4G588_9EUGL
MSTLIGFEKVDDIEDIAMRARGSPPAPNEGVNAGDGLEQFRNWMLGLFETLQQIKPPGAHEGVDRLNICQEVQGFHASDPEPSTTSCPQVFCSNGSQTVEGKLLM